MATMRRCRADEQAAMTRIINEAAERYRGAIPADCWHEPYMPAAELAQEIAAGVEFWGIERDGALAGVMGIQPVHDVALISHAYVLPSAQGRGIGGKLLEALCAAAERPVLVGTWAAAPLLMVRSVSTMRTPKFRWKREVRLPRSPMM